jgi:dienelactone hydrolase
VLVGASMGGSMTVMAVASGADVDAWVDLSGPSGWDGVLLADLAPQVAQQGVPGLVVQATSDGQAEYAAAQTLARDSNAEFLDGGAGHGYELLVDPDGVLLPAGRAVLDLAQAG